MGDDASVDENYLQESDVESNHDIVPIIDIEDENTNSNNSLSLYTSDTSSEIISVHDNNNNQKTTRACLCLKNWIRNDLGLSDNKDVGEINIDNDVLVEKDDDINCLVYFDE
jgi:hypothetical protein